MNFKSLLNNEQLLTILHNVLTNESTINKVSNVSINGEDYSSPVEYWMPFNGNIGIHDASWRTTFGGELYKTSGSHGCVNTPPANAKKIFEKIEKGMPVIVHN